MMNNLNQSRRNFLMRLGLSTVALTLSSTACSLINFKKQKPNIIYIMADDIGYGDLGCYGQQQIQTPNIDRLAKEGLLFTQHYAGSPVCAPSRACLMTGLHTGHARIRQNKEVQPIGQYPLADEDITIAEVMKQAGYVTSLIGKWGLGYLGTTGTPNNQGFDYFFGYLCQRHAHNYYPEFLFRNEERILLQGNKVAKTQPDGSGVAIKRNVYSHDLFVQEAVNFIEKSVSNPFFLMLTLTIPHANNEAGEKGMEVPDYGIYTQKDWPDAQKGYAAMISRMDQSIGKLMKKLEILGIDENTIVIFTSDNGPHKEGGANPNFFNSNGSLRGIKRELYEGGIRIPMIARWPNKIQPGGRSEYISAFWDMMPTFAELANVETPKNIDGISLLPTLLGETAKQKEHKYLYWEFNKLGGSQAIRMGSWKAIRLNVSANRNAPIQLFNLEKDIGETTDLASENPALIAEIGELFTQARTESEIFKLFNTSQLN
ncbi:MAG: arylsulfatase [Waterburya sp.]